MTSVYGVGECETFRKASQAYLCSPTGRVTALELYDQGIRSLEQMKGTGKWAVGFKYQADMQIKCAALATGPSDAALTWARC